MNSKPLNVCNRSIIHLNVADFAVAVERTVDYRLKDWPVIIAPAAATRAAVYDMSQEAYLAGIRKGMPLRQAARLCKDARIIPPHIDRYEQAMQGLLQRAVPYSPMIEIGDIDGHLFMDVTGTARLFGPPEDIARRLRQQTKNDLDLDPIWSVAPSKLVAKVATRLVKPCGDYIVAAGEEKEFLAPLPIKIVPGIEAHDLFRMQEFNFTRVCHLTALSLEQLQIAFGSRARFLYDALRGIDTSPVLPVGQKPPRIVVDCELGNDSNDGFTLKRVLCRLVEQAGNKLRQQRRTTRRVAIILDYADGKRCARQMTAKPATANDHILFELAWRTLSLAWHRRGRIRHLRLICDHLTFPPAQLELFAAEQKENEKHENLFGAIDRIRQRFGSGAIRTALTLANQHSNKALKVDA